MKKISVGDPMLVAQVEAWAERELRQPSATLRLIVQLGLRAAKRAGGLTEALWASEPHEFPTESRQDEVDNLVPFPAR